jgi:hypothetical protein
MTTMGTAAAAINERTDLGDLIAEVTLVSMDAEGFGLARCPLHGDHAGVIISRAASGVWHCAGCGNGGDPVAFIQRTRNMTRRSATIHLYGRLLNPDPEGAHPMAATTITNRLMRSTSTPHTAKYIGDGWAVTWLPAGPSPTPRPPAPCSSPSRQATAPASTTTRTGSTSTPGPPNSVTRPDAVVRATATNPVPLTPGPPRIPQRPTTTPQARSQDPIAHNLFPGKALI